MPKYLDKFVQITFTLEPTDASHSTGMTRDQFHDVSAALSSLGADNIDIKIFSEKSDIVSVVTPRQKKPLHPKRTGNPRDF